MMLVVTWYQCCGRRTVLFRLADTWDHHQATCLQLAAQAGMFLAVSGATCPRQSVRSEGKCMRTCKATSIQPGKQL
jgi:hypothetical protein